MPSFVRGQGPLWLGADPAVAEWIARVPMRSRGGVYELLTFTVTG